MTVAGLALGFGLLITVVGFPVLVLALLAIRGMATVERAMAARFADLEPPPVTVYRRADDSGWLRGMLVPLRDRQSWLDAMHAIVVFPVAIAAFVVSVTWWSFALAATTWAAWGWLVRDGPDSEDLPELLGLGSSYGVRAVFYTVTGLVAVASLPWVITATARARSFVSDALLISPSRQRHQVDALVAGRDAARAVEETALRRLERDIHDGPQQRLVRLSMDLGRAEAKIGTADPELSRTIADAKSQTRETLNELRSLSRGIAPPILVDRGLGSAVEQLAVRSAIPTACSVVLTAERAPSHVESAAYFVASEALANAAKHSGASNDQEAALAVLVTFAAHWDDLRPGGPGPPPMRVWRRPGGASRSELVTRRLRGWVIRSTTTSTSELSSLDDPAFRRESLVVASILRGAEF